MNLVPGKRWRKSNSNYSGTTSTSGMHFNGIASSFSYANLASPAEKVKQKRIQEQMARTAAGETLKSKVRKLRIYSRLASCRCARTERRAARACAQNISASSVRARSAGEHVSLSFTLDTGAHIRPTGAFVSTIAARNSYSDQIFIYPKSPVPQLTRNIHRARTRSSCDYPSARSIIRKSHARAQLVKKLLWKKQGKISPGATHTHTHTRCSIASDDPSLHASGTRSSCVYARLYI